MDKWSKLRIGDMGVVATKAGLRPGDFELGSVESRAAARALAERQHRLATDECDVYPPDWSPKTAAQKVALESAADILFFGGAAGSLKTETILVDAIRERNNPNLRAIIFRQQFTHMTDIVEKTHRLYIPLGAKFVGAPNWMWTFPSGGTVRLAYISCDKDVWEYLGPRYTFIAFDESTMHTEYQIRNMLGRLSATDRNLNLRVRLASNPATLELHGTRRCFCAAHVQSTTGDT